MLSARFWTMVTWPSESNAWISGGRSRFMDDQNPSTGSVPEIQNKVPKPPGVSPKNRQTVVMLAVGGLIALVIAFSNSPGPSKPKASPSKTRSQEPTPISPKSVQQYARQLEDD